MTMELDEEYLQTIFDTPMETKEFVDLMAKAAMDDKAKKSLEFALKLLDAHSDVPEIAKIVDSIKAAVGGGAAGAAAGNGTGASGKAGYGYPAPTGAAKEDTGGKKVKKDELKKEDSQEEKTDDDLEQFFKEKEASDKMLKEANEQIGELRKAEKMRGYMAKAAEFETLPQDGLPEMLMEIGEINPDSLAKFEAMLANANEANKRGKVMEEIGTAKVPEGITADIDRGVKDLMAKSEKLSESAARVQYMQQHPDAYERFESERLGQSQNQSRKGS